MACAGLKCYSSVQFRGVNGVKLVIASAAHSFLPMDRHPLRLACAALIITAVMTGVSGAQAAPASADTTGWLTRGSPRYLIAVRSPGLRVGAEAAQILRKGIAGCRDDIKLPQSTVDSLVGALPFSGADQQHGESQAIEFTIIPRTSNLLNCAALREGSAAEAALLSAAIVARTRREGDALNSVDSVVLIVGGTRVSDAASYRANVARMTLDSTVQRDVAYALRLYTPLDALMNIRGADRSVRLMVYRDRRSDPDAFLLREADVAVLVREALAGRVTRIVDGSLPGLPLALPAGRDSVLLKAQAAAAAGRHREAVEILSIRIGKEGNDERDDVAANLQLAFTFQASGDAAFGRWYAARAMVQQPCLTLPSAAARPFHALLDEVRPPAICELVGARRIVLGAWWPGRAQRVVRPGDRIAGAIPAAVGGALAIASIVLNQAAQARYDEYLKEQVDPQARFLTAQGAQEDANIVGAATYVFWAGTILHAVWFDRRRAERAAAVRNYGAPLERAVRISPSERGLGLSVNFF